MPKSAVTTRAVVSARINSSEPRGKRGNATQPHGHERLRCEGGRWEGRGGHAVRGKSKKNAVECSYAAPLRISSASAGGRGEKGERRGERSRCSPGGAGRVGGCRGRSQPAALGNRSRPSWQSYSQCFCDSKAGAEVSLPALLRLLTSFAFMMMILFLFLFLFFWGGRGGGRHTLFICPNQETFSRCWEKAARSALAASRASEFVRCSLG